MDFLKWLELVIYKILICVVVFTTTVILALMTIVLVYQG